MLKNASLLMGLFVAAGIASGETILLKDVAVLNHGNMCDDIDPVWMDAEKSQWVIGFARDNKTDRTQELGYWPTNPKLGLKEIIFATSRNTDILKPSSGRRDDYHFFAGYLCWAPSEPYTRLAYIDRYQAIKVLDILNWEHPREYAVFELGVNNIDLDWSKNDELAFVSERTGRGDIYVAKIPDMIEGGRVMKVPPHQGASQEDPADLPIRRITKSAAHDGQPAWSPDGRQLAYAAKPEEINQDIYVIDDVAGVPPGGVEKGRHLTELPGAETNPVWSPDGKMLAFYRIRGGEEAEVDLWVVRVDNKEVKEVAKDIKRPSWRGPSWLQQKETGRGNRLIYVAWAQKGNKIIIADVESGEKREVMTEAEVITDVTCAPGKVPFIAYSAHDAQGRMRIYKKQLEIDVEEPKGEWQ